MHECMMRTLILWSLTLSVEALASLSVPATTIQDSWTRARSVHEQECERGFQLFGRGTTTDHPPRNRVWSDDDFLSYAVGKENAGPDGSTLENGDIIFQSKEPLLSPDECQALIDEARQVIADGLTNGIRGEDNQPTNSELGEAKLSTLPKASEWLTEKLHSTLFPLLQDRFGVAGLTLTDALVIGYGYFGSGSRSQPMHRDSSLLSLNVALSPSSDYVGGGTYFEALGEYLHQEQGHVTCHAGGTMHAGNAISSGERWILVLFVLDETRPQLARRCHSLGLDAQRRPPGDDDPVEQAKVHFEASLTVEPNNHMVYKDLGRTYMQSGDALRARQCLAKATQLYPLDTEAAMGLVKLLLQARRPRAALRRLDKLLMIIDNDDLKENAWMPLRAQAWEARMLATQCAIHCAQNRPSEYQHILPIAMERLSICLQSSPVPPLQHLLDMMEVAKELNSR
jgi:tetratricopeptide (TPR) repeat protein